MQVQTDIWRRDNKIESELVQHNNIIIKMELKIPA